MSHTTRPIHGLGLKDILPSWITRAGLRFLLITDVVVIGFFAQTLLAVVGIAYSLGSVLYAVGQGLYIGCLTLTAAEPNTSPVRNATILRHGMALVTVSGLALALSCFWGTGFMYFMGQEAQIAEIAGPFLMLLGLGLLIHYALVTIGYMLEAKGQRQTVAFWVGTGFLLNLSVGFGLAMFLIGSATAITWSLAVSTLVIRSLALWGIFATFRKVVALVPWQELPRWKLATGHGMRRFGLAAGAGMAIALALMALLAYAFCKPLVAQFLTDPAAAAIALPLVGLVGFLMLGDGGQTIASNAAPAVGDAWPATFIHLSGYLILVVGGGWLMAFPFGRRVKGLIEATALASYTVLFFLSRRFWWKTRPASVPLNRETMT